MHTGLVNKIRLEAKYKYKMALKQAMINNQIELHTHTHNRLTAFGPGQPR